MPICSVVGCSNRQDMGRNVEAGIHFHRFPKLRIREGEETKRLCEERRRLWKAAVNRKDIIRDEDWERTRVCSKHFVGGQMAYLHFKNSPSWLPTLSMGYASSESPDHNTSERRYTRLRVRQQNRIYSECTDTQDKCLAKKKKLHSETVESTELAAIDNIVPALEEDLSLHLALPRAVDSADKIPCDDLSPIVEGSKFNLDSEVATTGEEILKTTSNKSTSTDLTAELIDQVFADNEARMLSSLQKRTVYYIYNMQFYIHNPDRVPYYTGLPTLDVLNLLFGLVEESMLQSIKILTKEEELLVCLVKLRLNYQYTDMACQLQVSPATIQRSFHRMVDVLAVKLAFLISWPDREDLHLTMPTCFRNAFGKKVVVIVDCFELFTEKPSGAANQVQTFSNYKHHQTVKFLIGIAPQGIVTYISDSWGGRASDKHIIEQSGILGNLLPGDIIMADRGFNIEEQVIFYQAKLVIPNFTRGRKQLHPLEVENTKKIAAVRIHVERVIGLLCRKFLILQATVPIEYLKTKPGGSPLIDKIVKICCCLINVHRSVVPSD